MNERLIIEVDDEEDERFLTEVGETFTSSEVFGLYVSALLVIKEEFGTSMEEAHDEIQGLLREINGSGTIH